MEDKYFEELKDSDKKIIELLAGMWSRTNILTANEIREILNNEKKNRMSEIPYDFSCWVIKYDRVSVNNKIYKKDSLRNKNSLYTVPLIWNHKHFDSGSILGHAVLDYCNEGVYAYCTLYDIPTRDVVVKLIQDKGSVALSPFVINVKYHGDFIVNGIIKEVSLVPERVDPDECYYPVMKGDE